MLVVHSYGSVVQDPQFLSQEPKNGEEEEEEVQEKEGRKKKDHTKPLIKNKLYQFI